MDGDLDLMAWNSWQMDLFSGSGVTLSVTEFSSCMHGRRISRDGGVVLCGGRFDSMKCGNPQ